MYRHMDIVKNKDIPFVVGVMKIVTSYDSGEGEMNICVLQIIKCTEF